MIIFEPGDTFAGRFRLEQKIGQGGMGQVWRATQLALGRQVALKLILPSVDGDARYRSLFLAEAQITARLMHPNLVPVVDFGEEEHGVLWLVQVFVQGCDLGAVLRRAPAGLPLPLVAYVLGQILLALQGAHGHGVIHRDLKPGNVLVSRGGDVLLTDFGIAKLVGPGQEASLSTVLKGSPGYLAPELLRGEAPRFASDLFAVGALGHELLCGHNPFAPTAHAEREQIFLATLTAAPAPLAVPPRWNAYLLKLLHKDPARRYRTATEALEDLRGLLAPLAHEATALALGRFLAATAETVVEAPAPPPAPRGSSVRSTAAPRSAAGSPRPARRTRRALVALAGLATLIAGVAALARVLPGGPAPPGGGPTAAARILVPDAGPALLAAPRAGLPDAGPALLAAPRAALPDAGAPLAAAPAAAPAPDARGPVEPAPTRQRPRRPAWEVPTGRAPEALTPR